MDLTGKVERKSFKRMQEGREVCEGNEKQIQQPRLLIRELLHHFEDFPN